MSAWRIGATCPLEWRDVNLRDRTLQLRASSAKNKRAKTLPVVGELLAIMERRADQRDPAVPFVFTGRDGSRLGDIRKPWNRACQAAGFSGRSFHDIRPSTARNAIRAGVPEPVVMELGGWRTRSVLARYNVVSEDGLAHALEQVTEYVSARATESWKVQPLREPARSSGNLLVAAARKPT